MSKKQKQKKQGPRDSLEVASTAIGVDDWSKQHPNQSLIPATPTEAFMPIGAVSGALPVFVHKADPEIPETIELAGTAALSEIALELAPRYREPPDDQGFHYSRRIKDPAVVLRTDGRYGVARAAFFNEPRKYCDAYEVLGIHPGTVVSAAGYGRLLGMGVFDTTGTSGWTHEAKTYATRGEAEKRAWALAREIGNIGDWP